MPAQKNNLTRLLALLKQNTNREKLILMRNIGYGGAAACLVILIGLTQITEKNFARNIATYSVSIALPLWVLIGAFYENYIFLGEKSYPHLHKNFTHSLIIFIFGVAGIGTTVSVGVVFWFLVPDAIYLFGVAALIAVCLSQFFVSHLANWWFSEHGPGSTDKEDV